MRGFQGFYRKGKLNISDGFHVPFVPSHGTLHVSFLPNSWIGMKVLQGKTLLYHETLLSHETFEDPELLFSINLYLLVYFLIVIIIIDKTKCLLM